jgi:hypothetical protein
MFLGEILLPLQDERGEHFPRNPTSGSRSA